MNQHAHALKTLRKPHGFIDKVGDRYQITPKGREAQRQDFFGASRMLKAAGPSPHRPNTRRPTKADATPRTLPSARSNDRGQLDRAVAKAGALPSRPATARDTLAQHPSTSPQAMLDELIQLRNGGARRGFDQVALRFIRLLADRFELTAETLLVCAAAVFVVNDRAGEGLLRDLIGDKAVTTERRRRVAAAALEKLGHGTERHPSRAELLNLTRQNQKLVHQLAKANARADAAEKEAQACRTEAEAAATTARAAEAAIRDRAAGGPASIHAEAAERRLRAEQQQLELARRQREELRSDVGDARRELERSRTEVARQLFDRLRQVAVNYAFVLDMRKATHVVPANDGSALRAREAPVARNKPRSEALVDDVTKEVLSVPTDLPTTPVGRVSLCSGRNDKGLRLAEGSGLQAQTEAA